MINRSIGTLKPRTPFYKWLASLPDPTVVDPDEYEEHACIFLLPDYDLVDKREEIERQFFDLMFQNALNDWWLDESDWPKKHDLEMFREWFDLQILDGITDLVDDDIDELDI